MKAELSRDKASGFLTVVFSKGGQPMGITSPCFLVFKYRFSFAFIVSKKRNSSK